jgi:tetratricopeptide (TPR) repeat protein
VTRATAALLSVLLCASQDPGALYRQGKEAFEAGRLQDALSAFTRAHELSAHPELLVNMAQCERGLGRTQEAIRLFERFIADAPDHRLRPAAERTLEELRAIPRTSADAPTAFASQPTPKPDESTTVPAQALSTDASTATPETPGASGGRTWLWVGVGVGAALLAGGTVAYVATRPQPLPTIGTLQLPPP